MTGMENSESFSISTGYFDDNSTTSQFVSNTVYPFGSVASYVRVLTELKIHIAGIPGTGTTISSVLFAIPEAKDHLIPRLGIYVRVFICSYL